MPALTLIAKDGTQVRASKHPRRPKFKQGAFGRAWQWGTLFINNRQCNYTYDATWGTRWYFEYEGNWYSISIFEQYEPHYGMEFTLKEKSNA